jgi:hypothetical protein
MWARPHLDASRFRSRRLPPHGWSPATTCSNILAAARAAEGALADVTPRLLTWHAMQRISFFLRSASRSQQPASWQPRHGSADAGGRPAALRRRQPPQRQRRAAPRPRAAAVHVCHAGGAAPRRVARRVRLGGRARAAAGGGRYTGRQRGARLCSVAATGACGGAARAASAGRARLGRRRAPRARGDAVRCLLGRAAWSRPERPSLARQHSAQRLTRTHAARLRSLPTQGRRVGGRRGARRRRGLHRHRQVRARRARARGAPAARGTPMHADTPSTHAGASSRLLPATLRRCCCSPPWGAATTARARCRWRCWAPPRRLCLVRRR